MRLIIDASPDDLEFAVRAIRWIIEQPFRNVIVSYKNEDGPDFYIKQNKKSLSVRAAEKAR